MPKKKKKKKKKKPEVGTGRTPDPIKDPVKEPDPDKPRVVTPPKTRGGGRGVPVKKPKKTKKEDPRKKRKKGGSFPKTVGWRQSKGGTTVYAYQDLQTGARYFRNSPAFGKVPTVKGMKVIDTFRVVSKGRKRPAIREFQAGNVIVRVSATGMTTRKSGSTAKKRTTKRRRSKA